MSLWPVSDSVTASQMEAFYRHYTGGDTAAIALRKVQLATIKELRTLYGIASIPSPALWAPFIAQGEWLE
jgi:CHAT domain-containing protein